MAEVFDLCLHRKALAQLHATLERRGLGFFLHRRRAPFTLCEERLTSIVEHAARDIPVEPIPQARQACYRALRRRLEAQLDRALLRAGP